MRSYKKGFCTSSTYCRKENRKGNCSGGIWGRYEVDGSILAKHVLPMPNKVRHIIARVLSYSLVRVERVCGPSANIFAHNHRPLSARDRMPPLRPQCIQLYASNSFMSFQCTLYSCPFLARLLPIGLLGGRSDSTGRTCDRQPTHIDARGTWRGRAIDGFGGRFGGMRAKPRGTAWSNENTGPRLDAALPFYFWCIPLLPFLEASTFSSLSAIAVPWRWWGCC